tara:strand:+ start:494 stop:955 length:462 start_codon:yes stop_codon:yes gene_type:complete
MKILKNLNLVLLTLIFTACTSVDYKPETVSQDQAGKIQTILLGTILDLRLVTIEGDRDLGSAAGAIIVGDLASDNDKAPVASGVIGALIGSAVGSEIGSKINEKNAIELTIELESGRIISIAQEVSDEFSFYEGQRVKIIKSNYRSRVQPFDD